LCMDGLPYLLPHITKRKVSVTKQVLKEFLSDKRKEVADSPQEIQDLEPGSLAAGWGNIYVVLWRGSHAVSLWVTKEEAASLLSKLTAEDA